MFDSQNTPNVTEDNDNMVSSKKLVFLSSFLKSKRVLLTEFIWYPGLTCFFYLGLSVYIFDKFLCLTYSFINYVVFYNVLCSYLELLLVFLSSDSRTSKIE